MNFKEIAEKRKAEIEYSRKRIEGKIKANPDDSRVPAWKARLAEYDQSMELIEFTIKTGKKVLLKGEESDEGVSVVPPVGELSMEGK